MRQMWGRSLGILLGSLVLLGGASAPAAAQGLPFAPPAGPVPGGSLTLAPLSADAVAEVARMAEAVNSIRAQTGRPPLRVQPQLTLAAQRHAEGMAQSRTMSHVGAFGSRPSDRMGAAGYETCGGGENVSFGALQTVDDVARGWYDSPGHRAILLDESAREMGVGRGQTTDGVVYWALEVGQRPSVAPIVINGEAAATPTSDVIVYVSPRVSEYCLGPARTVAQITLSNSADFADAQTFPYARSIPWTLVPGEGRRTVYARLLDSGGRAVEVQDEILLSSTAQPASTASDLTPAMQTFNVAGPNGAPVQLTIHRTSFIVPPNAAVTTTPCPGTLTGCWNVSSAGGAAGAPAGPGPGPSMLPSPPASGPGGPWSLPGTAPALSPPANALPAAASNAPGALPAAPGGNCPPTRLC